MTKKTRNIIWTVVLVVVIAVIAGLACRSGNASDNAVETVDSCAVEIQVDTVVSEMIQDTASIGDTL